MQERNGNDGDQAKWRAKDFYEGISNIMIIHCIYGIVTYTGSKIRALLREHT